MDKKSYKDTIRDYFPAFMVLIVVIVILKSLMMWEKHHFLKKYYGKNITIENLES